jgi:uncharacterized protein (UPF0335 family)
MQNQPTTMRQIEELTARCEMLERTKVQLESLAQMHRRMYAQVGPALGGVIHEELNAGIERCERARGTIDTQLFDHRLELLDLIEPGNVEPEGDDDLDALTETAKQYSASGTDLPGAGCEDLDALPILCDCGMEWDPSCYDRCPDCADLVEIAQCSTCSAIFEVDVESDEATCCPECNHNDRIYRNPITRGKLRAMIERGDALEAKKAVR